MEDAAVREGDVVLVGGSGEERRDVALALAARGIRVVVLGVVEREIAEIVGEIAFGGGKARHVVGDPSDRAAVLAAAGRCRDTFGGLDATYGCELAGVPVLREP